jgi:hypothetical protein
LDGNRDRDIFGTGGLQQQGCDQGHEARLSSKVGGVIEFIRVEEGQSVWVSSTAGLEGNEKRRGTALTCRNAFHLP